MGKTSHASFHCTMRGFSGRRGAGIFKVVVVLFTIVSSPSRRDLAKTARPPLCVLRDTARHRRWPPRGTLAAWLRALPGRRTPGAASKERSRDTRCQTRRWSPPARSSCRPAVMLPGPEHARRWLAGRSAPAAPRSFFHWPPVSNRRLFPLHLTTLFLELSVATSSVTLLATAG